MKSLPKKILFGVIFFLLIATPAQALVSVGQDKFQSAIAANKYNKESFDFQSFSGLFSSLNIGLLGCLPNITCPEGLKTGAIDTMSTMIASLYSNPPASGVTYFADVLNNVGVSTPAYAQTGTGFQGLSPLLGIWKTFRNFAYTVFVIVFVVIGLAIMFRFKLNPQTVVTIQSALPRIIVALLLVTFSYAIVGLVIDFIYILIALTVLVFKGPEAQTVQNEFLTGGFGALWGYLWGAVGGSLNFAAALGAIASLVIARSVPAILAAPQIFAALGLGTIIILSVILLIILYLLIKIFIELLKAYIAILFALILGPIQIALGVIPGFPGFGAWFKTLVANALIFPAVVFVILFGRKLVEASTSPDLWHPPLLAAGELTATFFPVLLGIGILLIVHQVPQAIKDAFGIKGLGFNAGQPLTVVTGPAAGAMEAQSKSPGLSTTGRFFWGTGAKLLGGIGSSRR